MDSMKDNPFVISENYELILIMPSHSVYKAFLLLSIDYGITDVCVYERQ